jgi:hypothetical protein
MAVVDDKPVFQMQDLRDKARLTMGLTETGDPTLFMGDNEGRPRLNVSVSGPSGLPGLTLLDDQKKPRVMLSMLPAGYPAMDFIDQAGKARIRLMTGDAKTGSYLVCQDQRGQPRASVGCIGDEFNGMGGFCIFTAAGQVVKAISE